jgi:PDZ domain-containing protein
MTDGDSPKIEDAPTPGLFEAWQLPEGSDSDERAESAARKNVPWWGWVLLGFSILLTAVVIAGFVIRVDYFTIAPGEAVTLNGLVKIDGAKSFPDKRGDIKLLFVRERNHVNLWRYLQAKLDSDIDLYKEEQLNPDNKSQTQLNNQAIQQMADAKTAATKVALESAGFKVGQAPGLTVSDLITGFPAEKVLELGDVILSANGSKITRSQTLGDIVTKLKAGDKVTLEIERDGKKQTVEVPVRVDPQSGRTLIGVFASPRFQFPVSVDVDTSSIGGPSAGLAMSLAILDDLTPGDLTGGKHVAVTGTIDPDGRVGEIGGISQKAVAARAAGAQLFLVPQCTSDNADALQSCKADLARATERAGKNVKVIPVATMADALRALRANGGEAVEQVGASDRAA